MVQVKYEAKMMIKKGIQLLVTVGFMAVMFGCSSTPTAEEIMAKKEQERQSQLNRAQDSYDQLDQTLSE